MSHDPRRMRALLDAVVAESSPTPARTEASLCAVEARLRAGDGAPIPREAAWLRGSVIAVAIAAGVLLTIAAIGAGVRAIRDPAIPARDAASDEPAPVPPNELDRAIEPAVVMPSATPPLPGSDPMPGVAVERRDDDRRRRRTDDPADPRAIEPTVAPDLAAEVALIRAAKSESDDRAALAVLDRHAREFPAGTLARERELLRAERLCALGRIDEMRTIAARLLADGRDDPLARRMRGVCADR